MFVASNRVWYLKAKENDINFPPPPRRKNTCLQNFFKHFPEFVLSFLKLSHHLCKISPEHLLQIFLNLQRFIQNFISNKIYFFNILNFRKCFQNFIFNFKKIHANYFTYLNIDLPATKDVHLAFL